MRLDMSFLDKVFVVEDPDARVRNPEDFMSFVRAADGGFQRIPAGYQVRIDWIKLVEAGSQSFKLFGHAVKADDLTPLGWTSTANFVGKFRNETIGSMPPEPGASRFDRNAAWSNGQYLGQVELVAIVDERLEIEYLAAASIRAYATMVSAAARDGITITLNSGFRSYHEQKYLRDGYDRRLPGFNTAAKPGYSKHQNGTAFDLVVPGGDGNPTYEWLKRHGPAFGFVRTVNKEPWHWELDPPRAEVALASNTCKIPSVMV